jgi:hypothetical protein
MLREILEKPKRQNKRETTPIGCNAAAAAAIVQPLLKQRVLVRLLLYLDGHLAAQKTHPQIVDFWPTISSLSLLFSLSLSPLLSVSLSLSLSLPPKKRKVGHTHHTKTYIQRRRRSDELHFEK